jgi:dinuclear metal center YbgI/SA1388 family protein
MSVLKISAICNAIERWYPIELAELWDQVGLAVGNPDQEVNSILLSVDITAEVLQEAIDLNATMIISHHPLQLSDVPEVVILEHTIELISNASLKNIALYTAHTNADSALEGVSDAIMQALGAISDSAISDPSSQVGIGRVGYLREPMDIADFARRVLEVLPKTNFGVKVAGKMDKQIHRIAVCGGSGASLLPDVARLDVDAYVTADVKHHAALDHLASSEIAIVNVSHWASEWLWLATLAEKLNQEFPQVKVNISELCTDPWSAHFDSGSNL